MYLLNWMGFTHCPAAALPNAMRSPCLTLRLAIFLFFSLFFPPFSLLPSPFSSSDFSSFPLYLEERKEIGKIQRANLCRSPEVQNDDLKWNAPFPCQPPKSHSGFRLLKTHDANETLLPLPPPPPPPARLLSLCWSCSIRFDCKKGDGGLAKYGRSKG